MKNLPQFFYVPLHHLDSQLLMFHLHSIPPHHHDDHHVHSAVIIENQEKEKTVLKSK